MIWIGIGIGLVVAGILALVALLKFAKGFHL